MIPCLPATGPTSIPLLIAALVVLAGGVALVAYARKHRRGALLGAGMLALALFAGGTVALPAQPATAAEVADCSSGETGAGGTGATPESPVQPAVAVDLQPALEVLSAVEVTNAATPYIQVRAAVSVVNNGTAEAPAGPVKVNLADVAAAPVSSLVSESAEWTIDPNGLITFDGTVPAGGSVTGTFSFQLTPTRITANAKIVAELLLPAGYPDGDASNYLTNLEFEVDLGPANLVASIAEVGKVVNGDPPPARTFDVTITNTGSESATGPITATLTWVPRTPGRDPVVTNIQLADVTWTMERDGAQLNLVHLNGLDGGETAHAVITLDASLTWACDTADFTLTVATADGEASTDDNNSVINVRYGVGCGV